MSKLGIGFVLMAVLALALPATTFADGHEAGEADETEDVSAPPADEDEDTDSEDDAEEGEEAQPE